MPAAGERDRSRPLKSYGSVNEDAFSRARAVEEGEGKNMALEHRDAGRRATLLAPM
jgi:hypothetical protein